MKNKLLGIILFAVVIEGTITYINNFFIEPNFYWQMAASLFLGTVIALIYKFDLCNVINVDSRFRFLGYILMGIVLSRTSNYIFDLLDTITKIA